MRQKRFSHEARRGRNLGDFSSVLSGSAGPKRFAVQSHSSRIVRTTLFDSLTAMMTCGLLLLTKARSHAKPRSVLKVNLARANPVGDMTPGTCFTIMPFSVREADLQRYSGDKSHWDEVYARLIVPAVERAGLKCTCEDEDSQSRLDNVWRKIEASDIVLCEMSSSNPNVFLALGWALRSDKRFVLIKDELTPFYFDPQQCYTLEYSHRLQPSQVAQSVEQLASVIRETLQDDLRRCSMVKKLALDLGAIEAAKGGNLEVSLLKELLGEIRAVRGLQAGRSSCAVTFGHAIRSPQDLAAKLIGSCWRKGNGVEVIIFKSGGQFYYNHAAQAEWSAHDYQLGPQFGAMELHWRMDNFRARCEFAKDFGSFVEVSDLRYTWTLEWCA